MAGAVEKILARDRWVVAGMLAAITLCAALWTLQGAGTGMSPWQMTAATGAPGALIGGLPDMAMGGWTLGYGLIIFLMWWLMMIAMMVPSAAPVILLYGALYPQRGVTGMLAFLSGYLAIWGLFSALATLAQGALVQLGWMSGMWMNLGSLALAAVVLTGAGLYQLTPIKAACLRACRGPVEALTSIRRRGRFAAFRMGAVHGRYCLGCCWALMALLFVGGIMNLWWILGVAILVALEKLSPWGERLSRPLGVGLILAGGGIGLGAAGFF
jgi:predicted metal-binding membrane protein